MIPESAEQEEQLVAALHRKDEAAMQEYYTLFYRYLTATCSLYVPRQQDLQDLMQDVFVKIFTKIGHFTFRGKGSLQAWSHRVAVNESLMFLRSRTRKRFVPIDYFDKQEEEEIPDNPPIDDIPQEVLVEMIKKLPERYRTVFNLYIFEEKSHREIGKLLHIKEDTSASNLHRAKSLLYKWIVEYNKQKYNHGRSVES